MRFIISFFIFCSSLNAIGSQKKFYDLALSHHKKGMNFTATSFLKVFLNSSSAKNRSVGNLLNALIRETNIYPFLDVPIDKLDEYSRYDNVSYVIGKKLAYLKKYQKAVLYLKRVGRNSPFYLQALHNIASIYSIEGNLKAAESLAKQCMKVASTNVRILPAEESLMRAKREYIYDSCAVLIPRTTYKEGKMDKSIKQFNKLPSNSYYFPHILFDSSWAFLREKDYNRAVGKNLTFQAPIMDDYFIAETELVKTLSYLKLCQYDEAINVMKTFEKNIASKANEFMVSMKLKSNEAYPFIDLMTKKSSKRDLKGNLVAKFSQVLQLNPGMQTLLYYYKMLIKEKRGRKKEQRLAYAMAHKNFAQFFNKYVKVKFVGYAKDIVRVSSIFAEIELDLYSVIKYKLYEEKESKGKVKVDDKRVKFYIKDLDAKVNEYYWNFHGEFWADELGNYIPLLENKCGKKVKSWY